MKRKTRIVLGVVLVLLLGITLTEYVFYRQDRTTWVQNFQERLHRKEDDADALLERLTDSVNDIRSEEYQDIALVGFRDGKVFFWTDGRIGTENLYWHLSGGARFLMINDAYYEIRQKKTSRYHYFALIRIRDNYPYINNYLKNNFSDFLKIPAEKSGYIRLASYPLEGGNLIQDKSGNSLFYIAFDNSYKEQAPNYLLLFFYSFFFISLFYLYNELEKNTASWKIQLLYMLGFIVLISLIRWVVITYHIPPSLFQLAIFDHAISRGIFINSIGDLLLTTYCVFMIFYITFTNLKINYQSRLLRRYRYLVCVLFVVATFLYVDLFNMAIDLVVEHMDIHLNIASLIHVGLASVIAFISIITSGLVIVMIIYSSVSVFQRLLSFRAVIRIVTLVCLCLWLISILFNLYTNFWDCFFIWIIFVLIAINKYLLKRDVQRSIYILSIFLLSIYVVMVAKKYESYKELRQRTDYATELIEERDYNFEKHLVGIDKRMFGSKVLKNYIGEENEVAMDSLIREELLNMAGYNYYTDLTFCWPEDSLLLLDNKELWSCEEYFSSLIRQSGKRIENTSFYLLTEFDGYISYIGQFVFPTMTLYLRFDATKENEGIGYPQLLSRTSEKDRKSVYQYSYAKYRDKELISSSGNFIYYKNLDAFGEIDGIEIVNRGGYSHMLIPVEQENTLVLSLHEGTFSFYYMNVLYAFFVCILISSYGLFFNVNRNINFRRGTLKARIKNHVISLVLVLFVILTTLSIYLNIRSFEARHNAKANELLKYINKELERLESADASTNPDIMRILPEMSEMLKVDINIYSDRGNLVATSRPEIFRNGFKGNWINPQAMRKIKQEGEMSYIEQEKIGELNCMSAYMPLVLDNGREYILNVPYFAQNDELNLDIFIMIVITVNIAIVMMVLAFILSGLLAERVTRPLQMINDKLKRLRLGEKNEKIDYVNKDEVGLLVQEYNNMVEKLDDSIIQLARLERETAWKEMARQVAHEIKNPLTPMKLNIQFMQRSLQIENMEEFRRRFKDVSAMLIEQIDNMASIASAFSDFAKMPVANSEVFDMSELAENCVVLFKNNIDLLECDIEPGIRVFADKEQIRRVFINILKNAEQAIPEDRQGRVSVWVHSKGDKVEIRIRDNGCGIPEEFRSKVFEPNFTTKSSGTGLGLAICRRIVETMNGTIGFTSSAGEGTEFRIVLDRLK